MKVKRKKSDIQLILEDAAKKLAELPEWALSHEYREKMAELEAPKKKPRKK